MAYEFRLPDIGEGLHEAEILQWLVAVGDEITQDQPIVEVQTDKAAAELSTPVGGKVLALGGDIGAMIKVGDVLIKLETSAETSSSIEAAKDSVMPLVDNRQVTSDQQPQAPVASGKKVLAAPAVRKLARELHVDLEKVTPSDPRGHISRADVEAYAKNAARNDQVQHLSPTPRSTTAPAVTTISHEQGQVARSTATRPVADVAAHPQFADQEEPRQPIRGLRRRIYENMVRSMYTAPQATAMDELDATRLVEVRERLMPFASAQGFKLTYLPFIVKAVTHVLREHPIFNASVDDEAMEIIFKKSINVGIATATPDGLLVPVIHHADQKSVFDIAREMEQLAVLARERKLTMEQMSHGTFTISSTGGSGAWFATPIVNYPEVAILGVHRIAKKPVVLEDDQVVIRHLMGFSLSFDHRVIDGEPVGYFMRRFKEIIEHPELLLAL